MPNAASPGRIVSVKFNAVGRAQTFVADDLPPGVTPRAGDSVVVHCESGPAVGTVVHGASQMTVRRQDTHHSRNAWAAPDPARTSRPTVRSFHLNHERVPRVRVILLNGKPRTNATYRPRS